MGKSRLDRRMDILRGMIHEMESVLVAFSGGVDSTFLAAVARQVLGKENVLLATACSPTFPRRESYQSRHLAQLLDVEQLIVDSRELDDPHFAENPPERCYYCKLVLFSELKRIAEERGVRHIADGTNADDTGDFRPGLRASHELGIRQPLREAGLTKEDIRALSAEMGLPTHDKPASACLASRFPYGETITAQKLERVDKAEELLRDIGFRQVRVRSHEDVARVELGPDEHAALLMEEETRRDFVAQMKELGYRYVALDLEGYRTGSMNEVLARGSQQAD